MVNAGDIFVSIVAGLAIPLAVLDGFRAFAGTLTSHRQGHVHVEGRGRQWLFALFTGPGLFAERMLAARRAGALSAVDSVNAFVITIGWAALYGFVVLRLVSAVPGF